MKQQVRKLCFGSCERSTLHFYSSNEFGHEDCVGFPFIALNENDEAYEQYVIETFNKEHTELLGKLELRRDGDSFLLYNKDGIPTNVEFFPYDPKSSLTYGGRFGDLKDSKVWMLIPADESKLASFEDRHQVALG